MTMTNYNKFSIKKKKIQLTENDEIKHKKNTIPLNWFMYRDELNNYLERKEVPIHAIKTEKDLLIFLQSGAVLNPLESINTIFKRLNMDSLPNSVLNSRIQLIMYLKQRVKESRY